MEKGEKELSKKEMGYLVLDLILAVLIPAVFFSMGMAYISGDFHPVMLIPGGVLVISLHQSFSGNEK